MQIDFLHAVQNVFLGDTLNTIFIITTGLITDRVGNRQTDLLTDPSPQTPPPPSLPPIVLPNLLSLNTTHWVTYKCACAHTHIIETWHICMYTCMYTQTHAHPRRLWIVRCGPCAFGDQCLHEDLCLYPSALILSPIHCKGQTEVTLAQFHHHWNIHKGHWMKGCKTGLVEAVSGDNANSSIPCLLQHCHGFMKWNLKLI